MKKYSKEFKTEALKLSDEIGVKKAAAQLGIQYYTIADWRKNRKATEETLKPVLTGEELRIRNSELERENAELQRANDILKDALGFFAKDRKK
jgi:transposase